jgi:hypothetical protein
MKYLIVSLFCFICIPSLASTSICGKVIKDGHILAGYSADLDVTNGNLLIHTPTGSMPLITEELRSADTEIFNPFQCVNGIRYEGNTGMPVTVADRDFTCDSTSGTHARMILWIRRGYMIYPNPPVAYYFGRVSKPQSPDYDFSFKFEDCTE